MSSYLDAIPQAVATIVSSCVANMGSTRNAEAWPVIEQRVVDITEKLTKTLVKTLREAASEE